MISRNLRLPPLNALKAFWVVMRHGSFEVGRTYRFCKGSGMPISIPVIQMIEIGAGGGSIASVNSLGQIEVGPESAGSEPGPACYQRGGECPAITDADLVLGKLDPDNFAGGDIQLSVADAEEAITRDVGGKLQLDAQAAAFGICELVDENMANASRVHAVENGKTIDDYVMIAFGGAGPLHAARLCEKLNIDRCLIPHVAAVGSAIGFLKAPFAYEALASQVIDLSTFDPAAINTLVSRLRETAETFVRKGTSGEILFEITAYMRYAGQGWEIPVTLPDRDFTTDDKAMIESLFRDRYSKFFGRAIEGLDIEFVTWSVNARDIRPEPTKTPLSDTGAAHEAPHGREVFDPINDRFEHTSNIACEDLTPGTLLHGPAVIVEHETSTIVTSSFNAVVQDDGALLLSRKEFAQ